MKLDRLLGKYESIGRSQARQWVVERRVKVDGVIATRIDLEVNRFSRVEMDDALIQEPRRMLHLMVHKPTGVVSATRDDEHRTVIDLIDDPDKQTLHLVGRLDRNTSGLVLLTNDGSWSKILMNPAKNVAKVYLVETRDPIRPGAEDEFWKGFYFHTEGIMTLPAKLEILGPRKARLTLHEGRYHQIKRMFHRIENRVTALHRESIGGIVLPENLQPGEWRILTKEEIDVGRQVISGGQKPANNERLGCDH